MKNSFILDLPYLASAEIIKMMDYKARFQLGKCSTRAKLTISIVPIVYAKVQLSFSQNNNYWLKVNDDTSENYTNCADEESALQNLMHELRMLFCFRNTRIDDIHIEEDTQFKNRGKVLNSIRAILDSLEQNVTVKVARFAVSNEDFILTFLRYFKPGTLKTLVIQSISYLKVTEVSRTEQWKQASRVFIDSKEIDVPFASFRTIPEFRSYKVLDSQQSAAVIKDMLNFGGKERVFQSDANSFDPKLAIPFDFDPKSKIYTFRKKGAVCYAKYNWYELIVLNHSDFSNYVDYCPEDAEQVVNELLREGVDFGPHIDYELPL